MNANRLIIIGGIILLFLVIRDGQILLTRNKPGSKVPLGAARDYSMAGGAICPKCHRPFRLSLLDLKLGFGTKFSRCEFCGKWSMVHRLNFDELRIAEAAEQAEAQPIEPINEKRETEKLMDLVDESRYTDKL